MRNSWLMMVLLSASAHGAQWKSQCESASKSSEQQCQSAVDAFKAADEARRAAGSAASGTNVNSNSGIQKSAIDGNNADLQKAISQCQQAKQSCDQQCDQAQQAAQTAAQNPQMRPTAQPDAQAIPGVKASECDGKIDPKIAELQAGKSPLDQQSKDSQKTKDASDKGGGMPSMPSMPKSPSDTGSTPAATAATALDCTVAGGSRFSDCNATFTSKCGTSMTANECDAFTNRFCNLTSSTGAPAAAPATTNLVIDKSGEGQGTNYCSYALSYRYCQTAGREQCQSCLKVYAQQTCGADASSCLAQSSDSATAAAKAACPDDPIYLTGGWSPGAFNSTAATGASSALAAGTGTTSATTAAAVAKATAALTSTGSASSLLPASITGATGSGGGAMGGGGSSAMGGGSSNAAGAGASEAADGSNREGLPNGIVAQSVSSGGAGDAGGSSWVNPEERALASTDLAKAFTGAKVDKAGPMIGMSADVANALGPSVFTVGSGGIRSFCAKNKLTGCTRD